MKRNCRKHTIYNYTAIYTNFCLLPEKQDIGLYFFIYKKNEDKPNTLQQTSILALTQYGMFSLRFSNIRACHMQCSPLRWTSGAHIKHSSVLIYCRVGNATVDCYKKGNLRRACHRNKMYNVHTLRQQHAVLLIVELEQIITSPRAFTNKQFY